jgi:hypothetical protein
MGRKDRERSNTPCTNIDGSGRAKQATPVPPPFTVEEARAGSGLGTG